MVFRDLFDAPAVLADDGGWQECGTDCSIIDWVQSPGATDVIIDSSRGGAASGVGAALGTGLGGAVAGGAPPAGPGGETTAGPDGVPPPEPVTGAMPGSDQDGAVSPDGEFPPPPDAELFPPKPGESAEPGYPVSPGDEFPPPPETARFPSGEGEAPEDGGEPDQEPPLDAEGEAGPEEGDVTDEDDLGEKPPRYRDRPIDTATTAAPGLEDDRVIDPDRVEIGPDGRPLVDPETGRPLPVDADGNVKYGDGWMSPEQAAERIATDQGWVDARAAGQGLVDEFRRTREELAGETDPARRAELDQRLNELTNKINESYSGKNILKGEGRTEVGADYDARLSETYSRVDQDFINRLNDMGMQRGGRPWTLDDITEFRNAASRGTVGMDRDVGLDEGKLRDLMNRLNQLPPNSPEALEVTRQLAGEINRTRITVDYDKYTSHISNEIARANAELERLSGDLANAVPGSPEAQRIQSELNRLGNRPAELQSELTRVQAEAGGRGMVEISPSKWNDTAASTYGRSFSDITGGDAQGAYQAVTQRHHQEAYGDKGVLSGEADQFDRGSAEQTASVSRVKAAENQHLADQGKITQGEAIQETARGYAKDIATKVNPHMSGNANVDPAKVDMVQRIGEVLDKVGRGEISPGQVDQALARAVPEVEGMTLDKATRIVDSNFEGSLKAGRAPVAADVERAPGAAEPARPTAGEIEGGGSRVGEAFGRVTDAATVDHYTRQHIAAGKDPVEAAALATAQTAAGNAVMASGIADPRTSMAGGALLPGGMNNMLPDQAVENWVGTTYDAGTAAVRSVSDSIASGQLDTRALDDFAEGVTQRQGVDPFKGIGQASQLLGEEMARTDGGDLVSDMQRIIETGAGAEVLNESMSDFQQGVAAGQHGVALQGLDEVARIAGETVADPMGTVGQFVDDIRNIATHGVGDGYWEESWEHTKDVIEKTPLVGTVVDGYNQIATGLGDKGVVGFAEEMYEGGTALAGEAYEAAGNAVGSVYDYLKSMW